MKIKILGGLLVAFLALTSVAEAQTRTPVINRREHRQERRINQGVRHHELTRNQAHHLRRKEGHIRAERRMAMANGRMDRNERMHLRHEEHRMSRNIYRAKHDRRVSA